MSTARLAIRRLDWTALAPAVVVLVALIGPILYGAAAEQVDVSQALQGASTQHWLGTDDLGRDIFARVVVATRLSVVLAIAAASIGLIVGVAMGLLALAPRMGGAVSATVNAMLAFPSLMSALFFSIVVGPGASSAAVAVGLAMAPAFARLTQTLGASVQDLDYVHAARMLGLSRRRVAMRHLMPSLAEPLLVNATMAAGSTLVVFSGLSFLGVGVQSPAYDWGALLNGSLRRIHDAPEAALGPGIAICLAGAAFALAGARGRSREVGGVRLPATAPPRLGTADTVPTVGAVAEPALMVDHLSIGFPDDGVEREVVPDLSLRIGRGERVALVGESGSGKTVTALALAGILPHPGRVTAGTIRVAGQAVTQAQGRAERGTLAGLIGFVFQEPSRSFNPSMRVGRQLVEADRSGTRSQRWARGVEGLRQLKVASPHLRALQFPHELSGGTLQRAMTAIALTGEPVLIIADEPTTALDVTVEAAVLRTLDETLNSTNTALLLITHDIAVACELCPRLLVMQDGVIVEDITTASLLDDGATHPYTRSLLADARHTSMSPAAER